MMTEWMLDPLELLFGRSIKGSHPGSLSSSRTGHLENFPNCSFMSPPPAVPRPHFQDLGPLSLPSWVWLIPGRRLYCMRVQEVRCSLGSAKSGFHLWEVRLCWKHPLGWWRYKGAAPLGLSWHTECETEEDLNPSSVIRWHFYLSWNPGIGLDDTSSTLAGMSMGYF